MKREKNFLGSITHIPESKDDYKMYYENLHHQYFYLTIWVGLAILFFSAMVNPTCSVTFAGNIEGDLTSTDIPTLDNLTVEKANGFVNVSGSCWYLKQMQRSN